MGRKIRKKIGVSKGDNYFLYELSTNGIKDFKKSGIRFNSMIHIGALALNILFIATASSTFSIVWQALWGLINSYCIMLQRYNNIRLNRLSKKLKVRESKQQERELQSEKEYQIEKTKSFDLSQASLSTQQVISNPPQDNEKLSLEEQRHQLEQLREFVIIFNTLDTKEQSIYNENKGQARV